LIQDPPWLTPLELLIGHIPSTRNWALCSENIYKRFGNFDMDFECAYCANQLGFHAAIQAAPRVQKYYVYFRHPAGSIDGVKPPDSRRPVKEISIRFQHYGASERGRALVRLPKLQVWQDLFDDTWVVDKAESAYPSLR
jgi:hypothetical protein